MANGQETRPRRVLTPPFVPTEGDTETQGVRDLLTNLVSSLQEPVGQPAQDPYAQLNQLLSGLAQPIAEPQPSRLRQVLDALAGGAAVFASDDPSQVLQQQLQTRQQRADVTRERERARQQRIQDIQIQTALQRAGSMEAEQAGVRQERRALSQALQLKQLDIEGELARERRQFGKDKWLRDYEQDLRKQSVIDEINIKRDYAPVMAETNRLINRDSFEEKSTPNILQQQALYISFGMNPDQAYEVARKDFGWYSDNTLSKEEKAAKAAFSKTLSSYSAKERDAKLKSLMAPYISATRPREGGGSLQDSLLKTLQNNIARTVTKTYVKLEDGTIRPLDDQSGIEKQTNANSIGGKKITGYLTPDENRVRVSKEINELINGVRVQQNIPTGGLGQLGVGDSTASRAFLIEQVDQMKRENFTTDQVNTFLNNYQSQYPQDKPIVDQVRAQASAPVFVGPAYTKSPYSGILSTGKTESQLRKEIEKEMRTKKPVPVKPKTTQQGPYVPKTTVPTTTRVF